jgi:Susd and RagB outer membrane lipoprotein
VSKWIAFANSLRLRLAMRIVYADATLAQQQAEKAVAAGTIADNTGNALILTTPNNLNYLTQWTYINPFCMSATDQSILEGFQDPRLTSFWNSGGGLTGGTAGYNGLRNGLTAAQRTATIRSGAAGNSFVAAQFLPLANGGTNPYVPIMTAAEVCFLKAEGALRGWNMGGGSAQDYYNQGITYSMEYWSPATTATQISAYIASTNTPSAVPDGIVAATFNTPPESNITVAYESSATFETQLEQIITQKWINSLLTPWEAWAERRRTGYPRGYAIISSLNPAIPVTSIIRRMVFPPSEYTNNSTAVAAAVANLLGGADNTMTRVWWDQKPLADYPDLSSSVVH